MNLIHNISREELALVRAHDNLIDFGKLFLPGDFMKSETPEFHHEIGVELLSPSNKPCAILVARGHAKTTLVKAKILHDLCFAKKAYEWGMSDRERFEFFGWCSSNQKKSKNNVAYVKMNLEYNEKMRYYFGKQEGRILKGETWNQEDLVTAYGDRLISSSNLTSMRGDTLATIEQGAVRYSCVFIDDAENEENTKSQGSRETITNNIMDGILPAIDTHYPGNRLYLIETIVHFDAFAQNVVNLWNLAKKENRLDEFPWKVIMYPATQPEREGGVLWNSWMPKEALEEKKQQYIHSPKGVAGYYQEYELQAQSAEHAIWTRDHVKIWDGYYEWDDKENQGYLVMGGAKHPVTTFIGCDPATDIDTREADYSAIMVIAVDVNNNVYVLEYTRERAIPVLAQRGTVDGKPDQIIGRMGVVDYIMDYYGKYHCTSATVEDVAMNRSVFQSLNDRRRIENKFDYAVIPEKPGGRDKRNRIMSGLSGRFSSGSMYYRENMFDLMHETVTFGPRMAHDDTIESLYYACKHAYPPDFTLNEQFEYERPESRKAKDWRLA